MGRGRLDPDSPLLPTSARLSWLNVREGGRARCHTVRLPVFLLFYALASLFFFLFFLLVAQLRVPLPQKPPRHPLPRGTGTVAYQLVAPAAISPGGAAGDRSRHPPVRRRRDGNRPQPARRPARPLSPARSTTCPLTGLPAGAALPQQLCAPRIALLPVSHGETGPDPPLTLSVRPTFLPPRLSPSPPPVPPPVYLCIAPRPFFGGYADGAPRSSAPLRPPRKAARRV